MKSKLTYLLKLELFKELDNFREGQFFAVIDQKVKNHLPQWIQFSPHVFWIKNPEDEKNFETYSSGIEFLLKQGIKKDSHLYAFGGGATTDIAGFIAATILGGIKWSVAPTTLSGMVEGSIGGKVQINVLNGKNLVGTEHSPEHVYICGDFLTTLSERELICGKGEILKYGFLSKEIHVMIMDKAPLEDIAFECARYKNYIIELDMSDQKLELGRMLSYAFEDSLKITQGYALAMALKYLFKFMKLEESLYQWDRMVHALSMPMEKLTVGYFSQFDVNAFTAYLDQHSHKKNEQHVHLVLVKSIASQYVEEVLFKDLKHIIQNDEEFKRLA